MYPDLGGLLPLLNNIQLESLWVYAPATNILPPAFPLIVLQESVK